MSRQSHAINEEEKAVIGWMIREWIIEGLIEDEMMARLREEYPESKSGTRRGWIRAETQRIAEAHKNSNDFEFDLSLARARFLDLYRRALDRGLIAEAHKILVDMCKLLGVIQPSPSKPGSINIGVVNNDNRRLEDLSDAELMDRVEGTIVVPHRALPAPE